MLDTKAPVISQLIDWLIDGLSVCNYFDKWLMLLVITLQNLQCFLSCILLTEFLCVQNFSLNKTSCMNMWEIISGMTSFWHIKDWPLNQENTCRFMVNGISNSCSCTYYHMYLYIIPPCYSNPPMFCVLQCPSKCDQGDRSAGSLLRGAAAAGDRRRTCLRSWSSRLQRAGREKHQSWSSGQQVGSYNTPTHQHTNTLHIVCSLKS